MVEVTLYASQEDSDVLDEAESLLETAYLEYEKEYEINSEVPKLEIKREDQLEVYKGLREIREGLENTDLGDLDRKF